MMELLEFLPLEKKSVDKKRKKSSEGLKGQRVASAKKVSKKARNVKVKKSVNSESDDIVVENKSVESSPQEISHQSKEISEEKKTEKPQIPRLFVNMKRVIMNEEMVKEIHPDIISIKYPRKKRSRWCWAIFASEKKADKALNQLRRRNDIAVTKPYAQSKGNTRKKTRPLNSELKKSLKTKLREAWM